MLVIREKDAEAIKLQALQPDVDLKDKPYANYVADLCKDGNVEYLKIGAVPTFL